MKLYEVPRNSKMRIKFEGGDWEDCTFHNVDGMYSYSTIDNDFEKTAFHMAVTTEMRLEGDTYYIDGQE